MKLAKLRSGVRRVAGVEVPRQDRTSHAFKKASSAAGHAPDAGVADGSPARARTDRPGRAKGGRVCRDSGGSVEDKPYRPSNELAEGEQSKYLRGKEKTAKTNSSLATMSGAAKRLQAGFTKNGLLSSGLLLSALADDHEASKYGKKAKTFGSEADQFDKADTERKSGGRVKKHADGGGNRYKNGGPLSAKRRNALPGKDFAGPDRSYPINDANHARNALARVSQHGSTEEKAKVKAAVHRKYPSIGEND